MQPCEGREGRGVWWKGGREGRWGRIEESNDRYNEGEGREEVKRPSYNAITF